MPETNAPPKLSDIEAVRADIATFLISGMSIDNYALNALSRFKMDLEDTRNIQFIQLFDTTNDLYFTSEDGERNKDKCLYLLSNLVVSMIFRDYAVKQSESTWWDLANEYEARYEKRLSQTVLDVDRNEDGTISDYETGLKSQAFVRS